MSDNVAENLKLIRERIARACASTNRNPQDITLIAICKNQSLQKVEQAIAAGQRVFGENYVQPWLDTKAALEKTNRAQNLEWHLVGHLQSNKAKKAVEGGAILHGVDSIDLLNRLERAAVELNVRARIFLQVNLADETQKSGVTRAELPKLAEHAATLQHVDTLGLMLIPPASENPEHSRPWFAQVRSLTEQYGYLSCSIGMSHDFEIAIQEGATHIRVGTAIFGARS